MRIAVLALAAIAFAGVGGKTGHADGPSPTPAPAAYPYVDWQETVAGAMDRAKREGKPIFIAINAERVMGKTGLEPAAKELREHTYHDPAVVTKSREFVCTLVKPDASSGDYAELRTRLGIDGVIVSPQHIFVHADGILLDRKEYWPHGTGAASVQALLALMDSALVAHRAKRALHAPGTTGTLEEQRALWLKERIQKIHAGAADRPSCDAAILELAHGDVKGDCIGPLCAALLEPKHDPETAVSILRSLGIPGLEAAVPAASQMASRRSSEIFSWEKIRLMLASLCPSCSANAL